MYTKIVDLIRYIPSRLDPKSNFIVYFGRNNEQMISYIDCREKSYTVVNRGNLVIMGSECYMFCHMDSPSTLAGMSFKAYIIDPSVTV